MSHLDQGNGCNPQNRQRRPRQHPFSVPGRAKQKAGSWGGSGWLGGWKKGNHAQTEICLVCWIEKVLCGKEDLVDLLVAADVVLERVNQSIETKCEQHKSPLLRVQRTSS